MSTVLGIEATHGLHIFVSDFRSPLAAERVTKLTVLDIVPIGDAFFQTTTAFALDFRGWSFVAAPYDLSERRR